MQGCFTVDSKGASGSVYLMWLEEVYVTIRSFSSNHVDSSIRWKEYSW